MAETICYLDIETLPTQSQEARDRIAATIKPPKSVKRAEALEKWHDEDRPDAIQAAIDKTSLNPALGHVCTIGWAFADGPAGAEHAKQIIGDDDTAGEADILTAFFEDVTWARAHKFVGHSVARFDLRFLACRAVVLGVRIPPLFPKVPRDWDRTVFDTMATWCAYARSEYISLDDLCFALGIPGKDGFDGSQVAAAWAAGEHDKIREYCIADVERVRAIHRRFEEVGWR